MIDDTDWLLLQDYFCPDIIDFDLELYGKCDYRRDAAYAPRNHVQEDGGVGESLALLDGCDDLFEDTGSSWLATAFPAGPTFCPTSKQEEEDVTQHSTDYSSPPVHRMSEGFRDRGCDVRPVRVRVMWPDPVSGCVYGGACALLDGRFEKPSTCVHPPLQQDQLLLDRPPINPRRNFSSHTRRNSVPFASRYRWGRHRRKRQPYTPVRWSGKKVP